MLTSYILVFLLSALSASAQCPTVTTPAPAAICDAAGLTFADLSVYVMDNGGGVVWYDASMGGNAFTDSEFVQEGTYYADDLAGNCASRESIIIDFIVSATGNNLDGIYCSTDNATIQTYIDEVLQSEAPAGGSVQVYYDAALTNQASGTDALPLGGTNYFIVFVDSGNCTSQVEGGSTAVFSAPDDPTPATPQDFCSDTNPTVGDLDAGSMDNVSWYANVDGNGDPILPALQLTTPLVDGENYFVQASDFFCTSNAVEVTVGIQDPFIAGTSATLEYCNDNIIATDFNLFDILIGSPDTVGTWTGPLATTNGHLGTVNITTLTTPDVYVFTYTVPANGACLEDSATVTITIYETFTSGTVSTASPATFCQSGLPSAFDLATLLDNEDPNGQWTQGLLSTDPVVISPIDLSAFTPGTYNFTYTQNVLPNPCPEESTTVQVVVLQDPEAGNAVNQTFCENDLATNSPFDLFNALDGTQDNNSGTWTDGVGGAVTNPIDLTLLTEAGSAYTYNYTIDNGTCSDTEAITITIEPAPESGTVNGSPEYCEASAPTSFDLFDLLDGEDQTGAWYVGLDNTGATTTTPIDLSILTAGTYNYTYDVDAIGACDDELVTITITINPLPDTGIATPVILCENDPAVNTPLDLFNQLAGNDLGGTWSDDDATGALSVSTVDLTQLTIGTYNYTYSITDGNTCANSTTVTVTIDDAPESGEALLPVEICLENLAGNSPFDLFTLLDGTQDTNGTWYEGTDTTGPVATNPVDITGLTAGTFNYTYSVPPIGTCTDVDVTVAIIINDTPNTGIATPVAFCENQLGANSPLDLFTQLSGNDMGGTWSDDDATGALSGSNVDLTTLTIGVYNFTYGITDGNTCTNSTTVTVTIEDAPESGEALLPVEICLENLAGNSPFDLFTLLDGTQDTNGTWYEGTDTTGSVATNPVDITGLTAGTFNYTYSVPPIGTCTDVDVIVAIIVNDTPNTGTATPVAFCENELGINSPLNLFTQLSGNDMGGTWSDDDVTGALSGSNVDLTTLTVGSYNFTYSITDGNTCSGSSTVVVTIDPAPESGEALPPAEICVSDLGTSSPFDLFTLLDGTQDTNGTWYEGTNTTGPVVTTPVDISALTVGTYNYTYSVPPIGVCTDVDVTVQIIVNELPNTGTATPVAFCENQLGANSPFDLFTQLSGNDMGGTWSDDDATGALSGSNLDLTTLTVGSYNFTYSITDGNNCSGSSTVVVTIDPAPESGEALPPVEICEENLGTSSPFDLFTLLDGTQDTNGTWYEGTDTTGPVATNPVDISAFTAGTFNYTYSVPPIGVCTDVDVTVQITINATPNTGIATPIAFCENDAAMNSPFDLFGQLSGNDMGGTWADDDASGALTGNTVDLTTLAVGSYNYTYTITDGSTCTSSTTVEITINDSPDAGTATPLEVCLIDVPNNTPLDLFSQLTGNDLGGTWTDDDATGALTVNTVDLTMLTTGTYNYTYTVSTAFCPDDTETVTITISDTATPTATATQVYCDAATVGDLVATGTMIQWYDDATGGLPLDVATALVDGETYYASQTDANCESVIRVEVTVTINISPNSGDVNANAFNVCENDTAVDLTQGLDGTEDAGGTWYMGVDTTGTVVTSPFDTTGLAPGDYDFTYEVTAIAPCVDATTTITLTIEAPLNPGTDAVLEICSDNGTTDLFTLIGTADAGGAWVPALASGTGVFDPLVDADGTYTYLLANGCGNFTSEVVVTVTQAPEAGGDGAVTLCVIDGTVDLFAQLTGTPDTTGTWSPALASGTGVFDPEVDTAGVYTYTVAATGFCTTDATAEVTVTVNNSVPPTVVDANPVFCVTDNATVADLSMAITSTGTIIWYTDNTLTTVVDATTALEDGEDYFATQTGASGCESSVSIQITATVSDAPTPVLANPGLELCINDNPTINDLTINIAQYEPSQDNVIWYDAAVNGNVISSTTPLTIGTTYYAVLVNTVTGCESSVPFEFTPDLTGCGLLTIPDGFSPNGDGNNETFDIDNVELLYPNFEMEIYNRYGNLVYKGRAATPRFNGTSNQPSIGKGDLPVGVYYYIFNYNDGVTKAKQGSLYLSR